MAAWVLQELQVSMTRAVATGIAIAFGDKKPPQFDTIKTIFARAPQFDITVEEEDDDGR